MKFIMFTCLIPLVLLLCCVQVYCAELNIHEKMYFDLEADSFASCVRRFNGTHQFGCSSDVDGNVGVLHVVSSAKDVEWLIHNSSRGPYVAILDLTMFTRDFLVPLNTSSNVNGVIVKNQNPSAQKPVFFSQEDSCPNRYSSLHPNTKQPVCDSSAPWNPYGTNIMNENWKFPIVIISDTDTLQSLEKCYMNHNTPVSVQEDVWHPLCAVEMQMDMSGNTNTEVCIRRSRLYYENHAIKQCDPLGGRNIVYSANKLSASHPVPANSIIIVTARLDSKSMFDGIVPGVLSTATSIVTLLATARVLSQAKATVTRPASHNVLFLLLDGEAYDFIGASRVLYDMQQGAFPKRSIHLGLEHVRLMMELSQLSQNKYLGFHFTTSNPIVDDFVRLVKMSAVNITVEQREDSNPLIPSSLLYFQNKFANLSGVVVTSSNESINTNKYYHSVFDDEANVDYHYYNGAPIPADSVQNNIKSVATTLGHALLKQMYGEDVTSTETVPESLIDEMLFCYLKSHNCSLFTSLTGYVDNTRPSYYVGIKDYKRYLVSATGILLANLTGTVTNMTRDQCKTEMNNIHDPGTLDNENYFWVITNMSVDGAGFCNRNLVNFTAAVSPSFTIEGYTAWNSSAFPTWSESVWTRLGVRMFLQPSPYYELLVLTTGLGVLSLSFLMVFSLKRHVTHLVSIASDSVLQSAGVAGSA